MPEHSPEEQVDQQKLVSGAAVDLTTTPEPALLERKRFQRLRPVKSRVVCESNAFGKAP
jgi:hypothetical protein